MNNQHTKKCFEKSFLSICGKSCICIVEKKDDERFKSL